MSHGLLQRLAERALGVAQPLRAQQVRPASAGALHEREADAPTTVAPAHDEPSELRRAATKVLAPEVALPTPHTARVAVAQPHELVGAIASPPDLARAVLPQRAPQRDEATSAAPVIAHPAQPVLAPMTPARSATLESATKRPPLPRPQAEAAAAKAWPDPLPLLPEQLALPVASPAGHVHSPTRLERITSRKAPAAERSNEVHVSIGRVELTALAPPASTARPARTREPSRSLADYLRPGGKGSA